MPSEQSPIATIAREEITIGTTPFLPLVVQLIELRSMHSPWASRPVGKARVDLPPSEPDRDDLR